MHRRARRITRSQPPGPMGCGCGTLRRLTQVTMLQAPAGARA